MPSGYTHEIYSGKDITFPQFAANCARAFGALVTLRDEPATGDLPEKLEPSNHYVEKLAELEKELERLCSLTPNQAEQEAHEFYLRNQTEAKGKIKEIEAMRERYDAMLEKVVLWIPPSSEHVELKKFMIKQIGDSKEFDCSTKYYKKMLQEPEMNGESWRAGKIVEASKSLAYYRKAYAEEIERTSARNLWIEQLRDSLAEAEQKGVGKP